MLRLSIPLRQALARLTLPVLVAAAFGTMLLGKADALLAERLRSGLADVLTPVWGALEEPVAATRHFMRDLRHLASLRSENARLREENERLWRWHSTARALDAENRLLRRQLDFIPEAAPSYRTARVVAEAGGVYARAVLVSTGPGSVLRKGQVALDERGLVGRVTEVGSRSARILLVNDMSSRIPVALESSRARVIMVGTNADRPRLQHWPEGLAPVEGERVVTSAEADAFPAGLPVGVVRWSPSGSAEVELFAHLDRLDVVRVFDYDLGGILPPEAVVRPEPRPRRGP